MNETLREQIAETLWQAESLRAHGNPRKVAWAEAGEHAHYTYRYAVDAILALPALATARAAAERVEALENALFRLKTECEAEGLADRAGFDCWISLANKVLGKNLPVHLSMVAANDIQSLLLWNAGARTDGTDVAYPVGATHQVEAGSRPPASRKDGLNQVPAERVEWRPIKTAPGSAFDWDSDLGDAEAGIAIARDEDNGEPLFFVWYEFEDGVSTPTKWRPLVEGPAARVPQDPEQGR